jgi:hypothetical protein
MILLPSQTPLGQPQGLVELNYEDPFVRSATLVFAPQSIAAKQLGNGGVVCDRGLAFEQSAGVSRVVTPRGVALSADSTSTIYTLGTTANPVFSVGDTQSFWLMAQIIMPASAPDSTALALRSVLDNPVVGLFVGNNGAYANPGQFIPIFRSNDGWISYATSGPAVNDGRIHTLWMWREGRALRGSIDGEDPFYFADNPQYAVLAGNNCAVFGDARNGALRSAPGFCLLFAAAGVGTFPSRDLRERIHRNPWAVFAAPRRVFVPLAVSAGAAPAFSGTFASRSGARDAVNGQKAAGGAYQSRAGARATVSGQKGAAASTATRAGVSSSALGAKNSSGAYQSRVGVTASALGAKNSSGAYQSRVGVTASALGAKNSSGVWSSRAGARGAVSGQSVSVPQGIFSTRAGARCATAGSKGAASTASAVSGVRSSAFGGKESSGAWQTRAGVRSSVAGQSAIAPQGIFATRAGARCATVGSKGAASTASAIAGTRDSVSGAKAASSIWYSRAGARAAVSGQVATAPQGIFTSRAGARCAAFGLKGAASSAAATSGVTSSTAGIKAASATFASRAGVRSSASGQPGVVPQGIFAARCGARCAVIGRKANAGAWRSVCGVRSAVRGGQITVEPFTVDASKRLICPSGARVGSSTVVARKQQVQHVLRPPRIG